MLSLLAALAHNGVPIFALLISVVPVLWGACAVTAITGCLLGALVLLGVRELAYACKGCLQRRRHPKVPHLVANEFAQAPAESVSRGSYRRGRHRRGRHSKAPRPKPDPS